MCVGVLLCLFIYWLYIYIRTFLHGCSVFSVASKLSIISPCMQVMPLPLSALCASPRSQSGSSRVVTPRSVSSAEGRLNAVQSARLDAIIYIHACNHDIYYTQVKVG